jgi:uncharacterized glyoxalase superfamily protein PhnB
MARLARIAPEVPAANLPGAIAFYEKQLGFHAVSMMPERDYAIVERDGIAIHLFKAGPRPATPVGVHIFTANLAELFDELSDRGVRFAQGIERKPWGNRDFRIRDDFGNELKFTEPRAEDE